MEASRMPRSGELLNDAVDSDFKINNTQPPGYLPPGNHRPRRPIYRSIRRRNRSQGTEREVEDAVKIAIDSGYRHIDTAWIYGTERGVGRAISAKINEGVITRDELFVTTKLWNTHHNPNMVMKALKDSLEKLQLDYLDLYLIHWPTALRDSSLTEPPQPEDGSVRLVFADHSIEDVYKAVEKCQTAGLTKHIGLSNFNRDQIEVNPYFDNKRLVQFCKDKGIAVTSYAPLGASTRTWKKAGGLNPLEEPVIMEIAKTKGKQPAQIFLRFHIQNGLIVIPKSVTPSRIQQNIKVFDFELKEAEMKSIASLNRNLKLYERLILSDHPEFPFHEPL